MSTRQHSCRRGGKTCPSRSVDTWDCLSGGGGTCCSNGRWYTQRSREVPYTHGPPAPQSRQDPHKAGETGETESRGDRAEDSHPDCRARAPPDPTRHRKEKRARWGAHGHHTPNGPKSPGGKKPTPPVGVGPHQRTPVLLGARRASATKKPIGGGLTAGAPAHAPERRTSTPATGEKKSPPPPPRGDVPKLYFYFYKRSLT